MGKCKRLSFWFAFSFLSLLSQLRNPETQLQAVPRGGGEAVDRPAQVPERQQGTEDGAVLQEGSSAGEYYHKHEVSGVDCRDAEWEWEREGKTLSCLCIHSLISNSVMLSINLLWAYKQVTVCVCDLTIKKCHQMKKIYWYLPPTPYYSSFSQTAPCTVLKIKCSSSFCSSSALSCSDFDGCTTMLG